MKSIDTQNFALRGELSIVYHVYIGEKEPDYWKSWVHYIIKWNKTQWVNT